MMFKITYWIEELLCLKYLLSAFNLAELFQ
jgi:hypothetical protein